MKSFAFLKFPPFFKAEPGRQDQKYGQFRTGLIEKKSALWYESACKNSLCCFTRFYTITELWGKSPGLFSKDDVPEKRHEMVERYRNHLIFVKAEQDPRTALWRASSHVQFNEGPLDFRDVWLPKPTVGLKTRRNAEKQLMREAKKWVDERLRSENQEAAKIVSLGSGVLDDDGAA